MVFDLRNQVVFGVRAFDEKQLPPTREQEWQTPTPTELATRKKSGTLVAVQRLLLHQIHLFTRGRTRCGKTATTLGPLIKQMLAPYDESWKTLDGVTRTRENRSAIVVIDLKADKGFLHSVAQFAAAAGREFRFLTLSPHNTWSFNPLSSFRGDEQDAARVGTGLLTSLQMDLGSGYGAHYFTVQSLSLLFDVCTHLSTLKRNGKSPTLSEAIRYIRKNARGAPRDSDSLLSTLSLLSHFPQLQPSDDDSFVIDMKEAIENRHVVMVSVDSLNQGPMARLVAGLLLSATLAAATAIANEHEGDPSPMTHTFCAIDEFHHVVSKSLESLLTGSAGAGLTFALSCQSTDTLKQRNLDLAQTVWENCGVKCLHTCYGEDDTRALLACSRETIRSLGSRKVGADFRFHGRQALSPESESDRIETLLTRREIQEVSATRNQCFVVLDEGEGLIEPIPTDTQYAETCEQYLENKAKPWPKSPSPHLAPKQAHENDSPRVQIPPWLAAHLAKKKSPIHAARIERFAALLQTLEAEENFSSKE